MPVTSKSSFIRFHPYNQKNPLLKFNGGIYAGDTKERNK